ncbi:hypothetical protein NSA50_17075 [Clostridium sp. DSM 100503]|uniref:hypothetical protein n=1 Tax=Clostridium sp. DSM 100503 TaxID=2963282 RepID=UPI002149FC90|nr:hypothetical protein [Clostridium sp. DSM 100503]MCR1952738.1 hypothetical protein [Clostridium sp. DSM 100503]
MSNEIIKRVNLRINIDDPIDNVVWNYIKNEKKKGTYIKKLIYDIAIGKKIEFEEQANEMCYDKIDKSELDDSGMEGF